MHELKCVCIVIKQKGGQIVKKSKTMSRFPRDPQEQPPGPGKPVNTYMSTLYAVIVLINMYRSLRSASVHWAAGFILTTQHCSLNVRQLHEVPASTNVLRACKHR